MQYYTRSRSTDPRGLITDYHSNKNIAIFFSPNVFVANYITFCNLITKSDYITHY